MASLPLRFPGQAAGEEVVGVIRKHPIVYVKLVIAFVVTIVVPVSLFLWFWLRTYPFSQYPRLDYVMGIFVSLYTLCGFILLSIAWLNEAFDMFIVTNQRLIDISQETLLQQTVASSPLEQIQDVASDVDGFFPTFLRYGNLTVKTASGNDTHFFIDRIPDPALAGKNILNWAHKT